MVTGGDADSDEGKIPTRACKGHRDHTGGGQPHPPTANPVRYSGAMEGSEKVSPNHLLVNQWGGTEETAVGRRGDTGERGEGLSGLRQASCDGHLVQITRAGLDGGG